MTNVPQLRTKRLILREWKVEDRAPFAHMNRDPLVMEYFPSTLSEDQSNQLADRIDAHFAEYGFGLWAVELSGRSEFIGYIGLAVPRFEAAFTPCVEVGWRLAHAHWGRGLATEGAAAVVRNAFETLALGELVSFTAPANLRSRRVMEKLGMTHDPADDFDHPQLPGAHPLRCQVLYRLGRDAWFGGRSASVSGALY